MALPRPTDGHPTARGVSVVYFVRAGDFVKVGITTDLHRRLATLRTSNPHEVELLGVVLGGADRERHVHDALSSFHYRREWFRADPDLLTAVLGFIAQEAPRIEEDMIERTRAVLRAADEEQARS